MNAKRGKDYQVKREVLKRRKMDQIIFIKYCGARSKWKILPERHRRDA